MINHWISNIFAIVFGLAIAAIGNAAEQDELIALQGNFTQGGLLFGKAPADSRVIWGGRKVRITADGDYVIGLGRDNRTPMILRLETADGQSQQRVFDISVRDYKMQNITGISKKIMSPSEEDLQRIRKEGALVGQARRVDSSRTDFLAAFEWPLLGPITGVFGSQRVYNGVPSRPHYGVDVAAPTGTEVRAPVGGVVTLAYDNMFYSGGTLMIDHGYGLNSSFLHLSRILVKKGDEVSQGQVVAEVGATGRVTGAHLDWRMNWYDQRIDPQLLVGAMPVAEDSEQGSNTGEEKVKVND
jgi:biotin carboxyl carrier protein